MDRRMLHYYERELQHLRDVGGEFAREFPKIAGRLSLDGIECADPYVERLLEGFAFLAARVQLKLDAEFPRFTQHLFESIYPHYLSPTPSMVIAQIHPALTEGSLAEGFTIERGAGLRSQLGRGDQTACEYRTAHDVTLWPLEVVEAQYYTRDLGALGLSSVREAKAAIRIQLHCTAGLTFDQLPLDSLTIHLHGSDETPVRIYEQLMAHTRSVVVAPAVKPVPWEAHIADGVGRVGFGDDEALLPVDARSFSGYRLLHEYFSFPARFLFFRVDGLQDAVARCEGADLDLILLIDEPDLDLERAIDASNFRLCCTPAINLFPKSADRIHISDRFAEFHVVPDRTRPEDFEVYRVDSVTGYASRSEGERAFKPFYRADNTGPGVGGEGGAYFSTRRVSRQPSTHDRQHGRRSSYAGSEVFVSLVDARSAPYSSDLRQLAVKTLCTNRDLPLHMPVGHGSTDFTMESGAPVASVRCVRGPSVPKPSSAEGETAWRLINHFSLNYLSLLDQDNQQGAQALRDLLKLYGDAAEPDIRKQIDGVRSISHQPVLRRVPTPGPIAFARGLEVTVTFDERNFEGTGVFLLGAVLEQFFARYVSINSFTESVVRTVERGEIMRWPTRIGQRHIL